MINKLEKSILGKEQFKKLKRDHQNRRLTEFVRNSDELTPFIEYEGHLYQKIDPIFFNSESKFIKAHFYAPSKNIFGKTYSTIKVNIIIIWIISLLLYLALYYRVLAKFLNLSEYLNKSVKDNYQQNKKNK